MFGGGKVWPVILAYWVSLTILVVFIIVNAVQGRVVNTEGMVHQK